MKSFVWALVLAGCGPQDVDEVADSAASSEAALCSASHLTFNVQPSAPLTLPEGAIFQGYGTQFCDKLYASIGGITAAEAAALPPKLSALEPRSVRVFFPPVARTNADDMQSFQRVVALAKSSGARVNVTWQGGGFDATAMSDFAQVLADVGADYATVNNEVNSTSMPMSQYVALVTELDTQLRALGVRGQVKIVAGDLVRGTEGKPDDYRVWIRYLAPRLAHIADAWSIHLYWQYFNSASTSDVAGSGSGIAALLSAHTFFFSDLGPSLRKPVFINEFGVRGYRGLDASGNPTGPFPGFLEANCRVPGASCHPIEQTVESALDDAWFELVAAHQGFTAALKWDAYAARYDNSYTLGWSMLEDPASGWREEPSYALTQLLTHVARPGWEPVKTGSPATDLVKALGFKGPAGGDLAAVVLNRGACTSWVQLTGLTVGREYRVVAFNQKPAGAGTLCYRGAVTPDANGEYTFPVLPRSVSALSNVPMGFPSLPSCG